MIHVDVLRSETIKIYDRGEASPKVRRKYLISACKAVVRNQQRADCIRALTISWCYGMEPSLSSIWYGNPVTYIGHVLAAVRNLRDLKILFDNNQANPLTDVLSTHRHAFRLKSFEISAMPGPGLHIFLEAQPEIEEYRVADHRNYQSTTSAMPDLALPQNLLPSLRRFRFSGHSECVRNTLRGRSIDTVQATPAAMHNDINRVFKERSCPSLESTRRMCNDSSKSVVRNLSIHLWGLLHHLEHFPDVVSDLYGISLPHIKSLRIESWDCWRGREAVVTALTSFPALEYFECMGPDEVEDWVDPFILACAKSAPTLRRISITHGVILMNGIMNVFTRVAPSKRDSHTDCDSGCAKLVQAQGIPANARPQRGRRRLLSDHHSTLAVTTYSLYDLSFTPCYWEYRQDEM